MPPAFATWASTTKATSPTSSSLGRQTTAKILSSKSSWPAASKKSFNLGTGQSPASIGHIIAFGNTEAYYRALILGVKQRGRPGDAFSEDTGRGHVAYKEGDYHDAIYNKLNTVIPFILEVSGGATPHAYAFLKRLARDAKKMGSADGTKYTGSWTARSFLPHHAQRLAAAAVYGEAAAIATAINQLKQLAMERCSGPDRA